MLASIGFAVLLAHEGHSDYIDQVNHGNPPTSAKPVAEPLLFMRLVLLLPTGRSGAVLAPLLIRVTRTDTASSQDRDFSHMCTERDPVPWDYRAVVRGYLRPTDAVLDIGTGGGEHFWALAPCAGSVSDPAPFSCLDNVSSQHRAIRPWSSSSADDQPVIVAGSVILCCDTIPSPSRTHRKG